MRMNAEAKPSTIIRICVCPAIFGSFSLPSLSAFRQILAVVRAKTYRHKHPVASYKNLAIPRFLKLPSMVRTKTHCPLAPIPAFSPRSRVQLKSAVDACLKLSPKGKCFTRPNGPIGTWDVSRVTDMSRMFARAKFFDSDVSKWDVSRVKNMNAMFLGATSFNGDLSKWDVSRVNDMQSMFLGATLFKRKLCTAAWVNSCLLYTSPSPRDYAASRMPSSA